MITASDAATEMALAPVVHIQVEEEAFGAIASKHDRVLRRAERVANIAFADYRHMRQARAARVQRDDRRMTPHALSRVRREPAPRSLRLFASETVRRARNIEPAPTNSVSARS